MSQYFPPYNSSIRNIKVELNLANYVTKDDVKKVDDKASKFENRLDENEKGISFSRGFFLYEDQSDLVYECKANSFNRTDEHISVWKSTGIFDYSDTTNMNTIKNTIHLPQLLIDSGIQHVEMTGSYFAHQKAILSNDKTINIYCVYELEAIAFSRDDTFTIQNALFGAIKITKSTDTSKYNYTKPGRNVLIFGADMSFSTHTTNKANNICVMGKDFIQGINDTTIYTD